MTCRRLLISEIAVGLYTFNALMLRTFYAEYFGTELFAANLLKANSIVEL